MTKIENSKPVLVIEYWNLRFCNAQVLQYSKKLAIFTGKVFELGLWGSAAAEKKLMICKFFLDSLYR